MNPIADYFDALFADLRFYRILRGGAWYLCTGRDIDLDTGDAITVERWSRQVIGPIIDTEIY